MFLTGISTRSLSMLSKRLIGRKVSPAEVSFANNELIDAGEKWGIRDLGGETYKYMFLDGVNFDMRMHGSIEKVPVLTAICISKTERLTLSNTKAAGCRHLKSKRFSKGTMRLWLHAWRAFPRRTA